MRYEGTVYRPPSEAESLIIQITIGCARNRCTFCSMYKDKTFRVRTPEEVAADLRRAGKYCGCGVRRIFLADGDALIVKTRDLLHILAQIRALFPECERVAAYGAPRDVLEKTPVELAALKAAGLGLIYMGLESGDDQVLRQVQKGVGQAEMVEAAAKIHAAGMALSLTVISGLGGQARFTEHAVQSALAVSAMRPEYAAFLTLMLEPAAPLYAQARQGAFRMLTPAGVMEELRLFISHVDSEGTVFRANHASNYVALGGALNRDKDRLLARIDAARAAESYKAEYFRAL